MRKISLFMLAVSAAGMIACTGNKVKYDITGSNAPQDGAVVYLVDLLRADDLDKAVVSNGSFQLKGKADKDAYLSITIDGLEDEFPLFNDGQPVQLDVATGILTGSSLNTKLSECSRRNSTAYAEYNRVLEDFMALPEEEQAARAEEWMPQYQAAIAKYAEFYVGMIEENKDNLIPVAFLEHLPSVVSAADNWNKSAGEQKFDEILAANEQIANHPYVQDLIIMMKAADNQRQQNAQKKQEFVGEKFRDLEEPDAKGIKHKLSEYVGRGNWVLVDFWASWCGPCKNEMPNVVEAYKKYHEKGFEVVGLSFDSEKEPWTKAIIEWGMPWIHLSDLKQWQTVAREVYNVNSIPDNLLIDPQGTIVARGLRGKNLEAALAEIFK